MMHLPLSCLRARLRDFWERSDGAMSVETAIILPILCYVYVASFVWFDAFRTQNLNLNATYTMADMLSRESTGVDRSYFDGLDSVYDFLTKGVHPTQLRVTVIECTESCDDDAARKLAVCWSQASAGRLEMTDEMVQAKNAVVPLFASADQLIMTETFMIYNPAFNVGLGTQRFENIAFTRPRPGQLKYNHGNGSTSDCNNNN